MENNWPKAIQYTAAILVANIVGTALSFILDSLWPIGVVVVGCSAFGGYFIVSNAVCEWRINKIVRKART